VYTSWSPGWKLKSPSDFGRGVSPNPPRFGRNSAIPGIFKLSSKIVT
jgi:hypothetical protein